MRRHIPNFLTLLNLFSGTIATAMAFQNNFNAVVIWLTMATLFDFLDGRAANLLNAVSAIGKELDSLADLVSFGIAPASLLFILLRDHSLMPVFFKPVDFYIPYIAFIIPLFAAYRLAKFNIDKRQSDSFLGLPTPANGLFWVGYCYGVKPLATESETLLYVTIGFILLFSWLMVSEIAMFSLKINKISLKGSWRQIALILLTIIFVTLLGVPGLAVGILVYIAISFFTIAHNRVTVK